MLDLQVEGRVSAVLLGSSRCSGMFACPGLSSMCPTQCHCFFPAEGGDSVRLLDEQTFELLDRLQLQQYELACSVCR